MSAFPGSGRSEYLAPSSLLDAGLLHQHTLAIVSTRRQGPTGLGSDNTEAICHLIQNASLHVKQAFDTAWALCHGRADVGGDMDGGPGRGGSLLAGKVQERLSGDEARIPAEAVQCLQRLALVVPTNLRATLEHQLLDTLKRVAEQCLLRRSAGRCRGALGWRGARSRWVRP